MRQAVFPPALAEAVTATGFSPAVRAGDLLFLTGATGGDLNGDMPLDAATQTRNALAKVSLILEAADVNVDSIVEITSYHIGLQSHFDDVSRIFREILGLPLPAWTAIDVAGLRRPNAVIEMRIVVHAPQNT